MITAPEVARASIVDIERLNKWFGATHVLRDISLSVKPGEKVVICGPSGSGKSTLIRCINQLEQPDELRQQWRDASP